MNLFWMLDILTPTQVIHLNLGLNNFATYLARINAPYKPANNFVYAKKVVF